MIFTRNGEVATHLNWSAPTTRTDGSAYGDADHAGYELGISDPGNPADGFSPWVSVPAAYAVTTWPLDELNMYEPGDYEIALRTVDKQGGTSEWSSPLTFAARLAAPNPPAGLSVS